MRRFALSAAAACGLAMLSACGSGGGYGFSTSSNGSVDQVVFSSSVNGQANIFTVAPPNGSTPAIPLEVDAIGQKGSGPTALVVPDATFTWGARFIDRTIDAPVIASYHAATAGTNKRCPALPINGGQPLPPIPIYADAAGTVLLAPGTATKQVFVGGSTLLTPADNAAGYCVLLVATPVGGGVPGSQTMLVSNNP